MLMNYAEKMVKGTKEPLTCSGSLSVTDSFFTLRKNAEFMTFKTGQ